MGFMIYDLIFLILFCLGIGIFLYIKRKNLKREGLLFLYRTQIGIKFIDYVSKKFKKQLYWLQYLVIFVGYSLMIGMVYLFFKLIYLFVGSPMFVKEVKIPPIMPLIPYLPQVFSLDFLPAFYFTYWIIIIAIIAIPHEFAHGIFAALNKVKIKKTGFGFFPFFLPVFLAAFVELDEKNMQKKSIFSQMSVLSAGTFANIITALLFFIILFLFFSLSFAPAGVIFDDYAYDLVEISTISSVNGISIANATYSKVSELINEEGLNKIEANGRNYVSTKEFLNQQEEIYNYTFLYYDSPAINAGLKGAITEINGIKITSLEGFQTELSKYSPGQKINITTVFEEENQKYIIELDENPNQKESPYLGVGFLNAEKSGLIGKIKDMISSFKSSNTYYESKFNAALFIYNLLWWLVLISFSVALINMLPVGIFDGGRFFYLTILAITKSKSKAEKSFKFLTRFFLFLLVLLMLLWVRSFF